MKNIIKRDTFFFEKFIKEGFWGFGEIGRASCRERVCYSV
jgi:hypothetical protein